MSFVENMLTVVSIRVLLALSLSSISVISCQPAKEHLDDKLVWTQFEDIKESFPVTGDKPLFLYISQSNCNFCDSMKNVIMARPEIAWFMNENFTVVNINVDQDLPLQFREGDGSFKEYDYAAFWNLFNIEGLPTYYCFDKSGKINGLLHAAQDVLTFKRFLKYVQIGHFGHLPWSDYLQSDEAQLDTLYGIF